MTISVDTLGEGRSRVDLNIDYKLKYGPIGSLMDLIMGRRAYRGAMNDLLAGLKYHSETGEDVGAELPAGAIA